MARLAVGAARLEQLRGKFNEPRDPAPNSLEALPCPEAETFSDYCWQEFVRPMLESPVEQRPYVEVDRELQSMPKRYELPLEVLAMLSDPQALWAEAATIASHHRQFRFIHGDGFDDLLGQGLNELPDVDAQSVRNKKWDVQAWSEDPEEDGSVEDLIQVKSFGWEDEGMGRDVANLSLTSVTPRSYEEFLNETARKAFVAEMRDYFRASSYFVIYRRVTRLKKPPETIKQPGMEGVYAKRYEKWVIHPRRFGDEFYRWAVREFEPHRLTEQSGYIKLETGGRHHYSLQIPKNARKRLAVMDFPLAYAQRIANIYQPTLERPSG